MLDSDGLGASVRGIRPKAGFPNLRAFDMSKQYERFNPIARALRRRGANSDQSTEREVSRLTGRIQHFMETYLGRDAEPSTRPKFTKLPAHIFSDLREDGALFHLLDACYQFAEDRKWGGIDLRSESKKDEHIDMLIFAENALKKARFLTGKKVYIAPAVPTAEVDKLRQNIQKHGAAVVSTADVATHIVYPDSDGTRENETDGQVLLRLIKKEVKPGGTRAFVHWWFHPDSYDEWIFAKDVVGQIDDETVLQREGPWHVQARWIRDLDLFNEWMNERDYEMPAEYEGFVGDLPAYSGALNAAQSNGSEFPRVRIRLRMPDGEHVVSRMRKDAEGISFVGLPSIANPDDSIIAHAGGEAVHAQDAEQDDGKLAENYENDGKPGKNSTKAMEGTKERVVEKLNAQDPVEANAESTQPEDVAHFVMSDTSKDANVQNDEGASSREAHCHAQEFVVPEFSRWFELEKVHEIERHALPEFFSGRHSSKTPTTYMEIRNFMIESWRRSPRRYLTATAARRSLRGDVCAILRVHVFLEHWSLINHEVDPETLPLPILSAPPPSAPTRAGCLDTKNGHSNRLLILDDGSSVILRDSRIVRLSHRGSPQKRPRFSRRKIISRGEDDGDDWDTSEGPVRKSPIEYHCDSCSTDCSRLRFHCATRADMDLCATCYKNRKYPLTMQPRDFIQMTSAGASNVGDGTSDYDYLFWTESETLLLLEALEMYGDNWELVAEHVGSKNKDQCVMQFVRIPIEDAFLSASKEKWWPGGALGPDGMVPLEMMRKAGAKEAALQSLSVKGSASRALSGQSAMYTDQRQRVTPNVVLLSSLVPQAVFARILARMLCNFSLSEFQGNMSDLIESHSSTNSREGKAPDETEIDSALWANIATRKPYAKLLHESQTADMLAVGKIGGAVAKFSLRELGMDSASKTLYSGDFRHKKLKISPGTFIHLTSASDESENLEIDENAIDCSKQEALAAEESVGKDKSGYALQGDGSPCSAKKAQSPCGAALDIDKNMEADPLPTNPSTSPSATTPQANHDRASATADGDTIHVNGIDMNRNDKEQGTSPKNTSNNANIRTHARTDACGKKRPRTMNVDSLSSQSVAIVALASAAFRAGQLQLLERAELDRLLTMVIEIKLATLQKKSEQLKVIAEYERKVKKRAWRVHPERFRGQMTRAFAHFTGGGMAPRIVKLEEDPPQDTSAKVAHHDGSLPCQVLAGPSYCRVRTKPQTNGYQTQNTKNMSPNSPANTHGQEDVSSGATHH